MKSPVADMFPLLLWPRRQVRWDGILTAAMQAWMHAFSFPHRVAELARQVEAWGFDGLLVADSQDLNADVWVELALAGAATQRIALGPGVTNPATATLPSPPRLLSPSRWRPPGERCSGSGAARRFGPHPDRAGAGIGRRARAGTRCSPGV